MENKSAKDLCIALMKADTEEEVIALLDGAGYWSDETKWHLFGDNPNNYAVAGAQQSKADAALVEKIVNSIDARLTDQVLKRGINPESEEAPEDIRFAVAKFIEKHSKPESDRAGRVQFWSDQQRTKISEDIAVVATGMKPGQGNPCFSIVDRGEGQTPDMVPETFMSLIRSNKAKIPFVQGKFNMGGTGVFRFCGSKSLQLVVTRRDPIILEHTKRSDDDDCWSFTVVRRDDPKEDERSSVYRYLAPVDADKNPGKGGVIRFRSKVMPLFPTKGQAYCVNTEWGTLIKLYEYNAQGFRSHILMGDGLKGRLDLMMSDPALPVRLHECRGYKGHKGSFENTLTGLSVRLADDKMEKLEEGFPVSCPISISGEELICTIYAFKKGETKNYRKDEGLIFTYNGQTHAKINKSYFKGDRVRLGYLANSLLVILGCSKLSRPAFEKLFMNSRDRLCEDADLTKIIKDEVAYMLKNHEGLRELANRRREEEIASQLDDSKPLEDVLEIIFKKSPSLSSLFLKGTRLSSAFKSKKVREEEKAYVGRQFPSFFHFKGKNAGEKVTRECHINMRCRIQFETDVENGYFSRIDQPGRFALERLTFDGAVPVKTYVGPNLSNGLATLTFPLPEACEVDDACTYRAGITDETQIEAFVSEFSVKVLPRAKVKGGKGKRKKPASEEGGEERELPGGIKLPDARWVSEEEWANKEPPFDQHTALRIVNSGYISGADDDESAPSYDFFINKDNIYLKAETKGGKEDPRLMEERFRVGMVLIGLALIHDASKINKLEHREEEAQGGDDEDGRLEEKVEETTRAIAPFLLPMIASLGTLDESFEEKAA